MYFAHINLCNIWIIKKESNMKKILILLISFCSEFSIFFEDLIIKKNKRIKMINNKVMTTNSKFMIINYYLKKAEN